jgi:hypothetical protein
MSKGRIEGAGVASPPLTRGDGRRPRCWSGSVRFLLGFSTVDSAAVRRSSGFHRANCIKRQDGSRELNRVAGRLRAAIEDSGGQGAERLPPDDLPREPPDAGAVQALAANGAFEDRSGEENQTCGGDVLGRTRMLCRARACA